MFVIPQRANCDDAPLLSDPVTLTSFNLPLLLVLAFFNVSVHVVGVMTMKQSKQVLYTQFGLLQTMYVIQQFPGGRGGHGRKAAARALREEPQG